MVDALDRRQRLSSALPDLHARQRRRGLPRPGHAAHARRRHPAGRVGLARRAGCASAPSTTTSSTPTSSSQLGITGGYCYLNASLMRLFGERAPGLSWQMMDEQFFGAQPGIPPYEEQPGDIRPDLTEKLGATFGWASAASPSCPSWSTTSACTEGPAGRPARPRRSCHDRGARRALPTACWDATSGSCSRSTSSPRSSPRCRSASWPAVCAAIGQPGALLDLIAGLGDVDSAAPSFALWDLGRIVAGAPELTARLRRRRRRAGSSGSGALDDAGRRRRSSPGFDDFVREYGSRGPERVGGALADAGRRVPELALAAIDRMRLSPDGAAPTRQNAARAEVREATAAAIAEALAVDPQVQGQFLAARPRRHGVAAGPRADQDQRHPPHPRGPHGDPRAGSAHGGARRRSTRSRTSASCASAELDALSWPTRAR